MQGLTKRDNKTMGKNTIYFGRLAGLRNWWNEKSEMWSRLCGDEYTHGEVVVVNVIAVLMMLVVGLAEEHPLMALGVAGCAVPLVRWLKKL